MLPEAGVTTKLLLLMVMSMAPESTLKDSTCSLCQWMPVAKVEPAGTFTRVLEGSSKERVAEAGAGVVKVEMWVVCVRVAIVDGRSRR